MWSRTRFRFNLRFARLITVFLLLSQILYADHQAPPTDIHMEMDNVEAVVGLRPWRRGGIRIEREMFHNLIVIHNYGHGGAGLTLSWGTVEEAIGLVPELSRYTRPIVIIGGGVIGLTTAYELLRRGYSVTVYAEEFYPNTVSAIAGGLWSPVSVDLSSAGETEKKRIDRMQRNSYLRYASLLGSPWGVRSLPLYVTEEAREKSGLALFERMEDFFKVTRHTQLPIEGVTQGGYEVQTFLIDTPIFMNRLYNRVRAMGATFVQQKIDSLDDFANELEEGTLLFNCSGLGAMDLVGDTNLTPIAGDIIYAKKKEGFDPINYDFMAFYGPGGTDYVFPRSGELVIGGTFRIGVHTTEVSPDICKQKLRSYSQFFNGG